MPSLIKNVKTIDNEKIDLEINNAEGLVIDAGHLIALPALIDPHVHFRTPGLEHKEDWRTAAKASIYGGYTTVFDMPNTVPATITTELLQQKKAVIDAQLKEIGIPLRYQLFFGADKNHLTEIYKVKDAVVGIKVFMGCSTGNLVIDDDNSLHAVFAIAASLNMLVAVHAEDEHMLKERKANYKAPLNYNSHSELRPVEAAVCAVEKAIALTRIYGTKLYILHVSSADEINLIRKAKQEGLPVFAETTPHHLFLHTGDYEKWGGKVVMNPPLRDKSHQAALFQAIHDGTLDTLGTDHAPHTTTEKNQPYGTCPCGVPGIETALPLLLNAYHEKLLSLEEIVALTSKNARKIFDLPSNNDMVLVDLNKQKTVSDQQLKTKCGWSPFTGRTLKGWPVYTILKGHLYDLT